MQSYDGFSKCKVNANGLLDGIMKLTNYMPWSESGVWMRVHELCRDMRRCGARVWAD